MYAHSAVHIQRNLINAIAFSPAQLRAFSHIAKFDRTLKVPESTSAFRLSAAFHTLSLRMLFRALSGLEIFTSFCVFRCGGPFAAVALSLQNLFRYKTSFAAESLSLQILFRCRSSFAADPLSL
jgi:hypothetical protein